MISGWDHPRTCGEKNKRVKRIELAKGSPPHMRGKGSLRGLLRMQLGITPAHAGKSSWDWLWRAAPGDHPRTCGEKSTSRRDRSRCEGSPPHMRGKVVMVPLSSLLVGITPAHAGKSPWPPGRFPGPRDHPRTCGEKIWLPDCNLKTVGSPPHMRGKESEDLRQYKPIGITPAHAGKRHPPRLAAG